MLRFSTYDVVDIDYVRSIIGIIKPICYNAFKDTFRSDITMRMVSITEIRRNAKAVLADLTRTKSPIAILQRSKHIAYIVDAESYTKMHFQGENYLMENRKKKLEEITQLQKRVASKIGRQEDSVELIRKLRDGNNRHE